MSLLDEMAAGMGVGRADLARFLYAAPARYKVYQIAKRSGGQRTIAQPSSSLKALQRFVTAEKISLFPVHPAAAAYVRGKGIGDNAERHKNNAYLLKLDFENFFNSITIYDWRNLVAKSKIEGISKKDSLQYERLLFWGAGGYTPKILSVGAPSSPALSNAVMYDFDVAVAKAARKQGAKYTRYADDMSISAMDRESCLQVERSIRQLVRESRSPRLRLNEDKRGLYGPGQKRMVTGLVITPERTVSLGRDRKRVISAMLHRATIGHLDVVQIAKLKGWLGLAVDVEPVFVERLREKYGDRIVDEVMKFDGTALPDNG